MDFSTGDQSKDLVSGTCEGEHLFDKMTASGASLPERGPAISRVETDASVDSMDKQPTPLLDWAEQNKVVPITQNPISRARALLAPALVQLRAIRDEIEANRSRYQQQPTQPELSLEAPPALQVVQGGRR
jgi:hypothetical protein